MEKARKEGMMESLINCPECGEQNQVALKDFEDGALSLLLEGKTKHYAGDCKCKCGKHIVVSLHITAGD